jgi:hypothetical protein
MRFSSLYPSGSTASNYIFANDGLDSTAGVNGGLQALGLRFHVLHDHRSVTLGFGVRAFEYRRADAGRPRDTAAEPVDPGGVDQSPRAVFGEPGVQRLEKHR